jgi:hypothetical protein
MARIADTAARYTSVRSTSNVVWGTSRDQRTESEIHPASIVQATP